MRERWHIHVFTAPIIFLLNLAILSMLSAAFPDHALDPWTEIAVDRVELIGSQKSPNVTEVSRDGGISGLIGSQIIWYATARRIICSRLTFRGSLMIQSVWASMAISFLSCQTPPRRPIRMRIYPPCRTTASKWSARTSEAESSTPSWRTPSSGPEAGSRSIRKRSTSIKENKDRKGLPSVWTSSTSNPFPCV